MDNNIPIDQSHDITLAFSDHDFHQWKKWNFNGGKIKNILKADLDPHVPKNKSKTENNNTNTTTPSEVHESDEEVFSSGEAKEAFYYGKVSLKVHGECVCLVSSDFVINNSRNSTSSLIPNDNTILHTNNNENNNVSNTTNEWLLYQRYDMGSKLDLNSTSENMVLPVDCIRLFDIDTLQPDRYTSGEKAHFYLWRKLDLNSKPVKQTMSNIELAIEKGLFPTPEKWGKPYMTCEWVGKRHQGNKYGLDYDHALYPHGATTIDIPSSLRTLDQMCKYAVTQQIEGFIFQHPVTFKLFKLRCNSLVAEKLTAFHQYKIVNITPLFF